MNIIKDLFDSKKFVSALLTMIAAVAIRLGAPEIEIQEIIALVSPMLVFIGAQGFADIGKEKVYAEEAAKHNRPQYQVKMSKGQEDEA